MLPPNTHTLCARARGVPTTRRRRVDAAALRALAHPLRLRILSALRDGPATSTLLARELRESRGATSYHLRELARYGLIEELADRGRGRERWWQRPEGVAWLVGEPGVEARAAGMSAFSVIVANDEQALARFIAAEDELDDEWRDAATIVGWNVDGTAADVGELADGIAALVERIRERPRSGSDAKPVRVTLRILPQPANPEGSAAARRVSPEA